MIIECNACNKKFSVPDAAITANGRLVQCSSCGNKWTQYPQIKEKKQIKTKTKTSNISKKSIQIKKKTPAPYSKEYMQQKWGTSIKEYTSNKELSKKKKASNEKKSRKQKNTEKVTDVGFGFFNYLIIVTVLTTFFVGILNFERTRLTRKFPFLEPYINNFYETLENFKFFIIDLIK
ncbi:MAG: hypothetical protein CMG67_00850 [Candidatus Marinimicrobia bacterium]|nr:hypothetical protein [Candidatus Neomarinimicrobiota bacterium]|tara:strand:- start:18508 stop:19038 length:531 start_codon:yes stop_codon:yes gene_type:complete